MVVPCLALAIMGWTLRDRSGVVLPTPTNRFALVVDEVKEEPVTPSEVASGYSMKLVVTLSHKGTAPAWWKIGFRNSTFVDALKPQKAARYLNRDMWVVGIAMTYLKNGEVQQVDGVSRVSNKGSLVAELLEYDRKRDRYVASYLLGLSKMPQELGQIRFQAIYGANTDDFTPLSVVVREAETSSSRPQISTYCPIKFERAIFSRMEGEMRVVVSLKYTGDAKNSNNLKWSSGSGYLVDGKGRIYEMFNTKSGRRSINWSPPYRYDKNPLHYQCSYGIPLSTVPANRGKLTLKDKVSVNDCWPLPISIVVRDNTKAVVKVAAKQ